ncbi:SDR family NAD(P)-dependent oxidoreductase [Puniceicoccales bacterium CK1056]|uniref:SDR family NAD(P)-dependent oxidoreductase n=1 Tax=Oceanipulchritudo coccoides TaxID=2706888 RepID=A0A6B2M0L6_9BACT|nr:SDR family NAD(P)-dependent oxidoreductase [Oceanipulchritudo coccoides]NDV61859.1 SDR family NAD(P)-dependent oxidoreductase [Oceanipulchritudo coccoides]
MKETIFITGVSRGLGHGLAKVYLESGHTVFGCSRGECDLVEAYPEQFNYASIDLADHLKGKSTLENWLKRVSGFDRVILNAGILSEIRDMRDTPLESLRDTMEINVWSNKWLLDALLRMEQKPRQVVAISSGAAVSGSRGWNGYSISKAALNMLVMLYAAEEPEVHFTSLAPGLIDTAMQDYICGIEADQNFETVRRLKKAKNTPDMPSAEAAAHRISSAMEKFMSEPSGSFIDIRKMKS